MKHEDVYLKGYGAMLELQQGLTEYFDFYNFESPHRTATGGGASIVDKFGQATCQVAAA